MTPSNAHSIIAIAWKGVTRKMFRNLILMLAVALLVALLTFAMLFNKAVEEDIDEASKRLGADIVIVPSEAKGNAEEFILESKIKSFYMDKFVFDDISGLPDIKQATYHIYLNTLTSGCCSIDEGQVIVFDQDKDFVVAPWLEAGPKRLEPGQVYVGSYVYEFLGLINTASLRGGPLAGGWPQASGAGAGLCGELCVRVSRPDQHGQSLWEGGQGGRASPADPDRS